MPLPNLIYANTTDVGNVGTGEDTLMSFALPANTLSENGRCLRITAGGFYNATADTKTLRFKVGTDSFTLNPGTPAPNGLTWMGEILVVRTSANNQLVFMDAFGFDPNTGASQGAATQTDSNVITLKFTGESATAMSDNIGQQFMFVELLN
jgi:hypothetical protein